MRASASSPSCGLQHVVAGGHQVVAHHRAHEPRVVGHEHAGGGLPVPAGQRGVHRARQLLLGGALGEDGVDVQAVARAGDRVGRAGADEDEGELGRGRVVADGAQQRQAVHRRHVDVADDDVDGGGAQHVEGVAAVAGAAHLEAGAAQEVGVDAKGDRAVVDQEHGGAGAHRRLRRAGTAATATPARGEQLLAAQDEGQAVVQAPRPCRPAPRWRRRRRRPARRARCRARRWRRARGRRSRPRRAARARARRSPPAPSAHRGRGAHERRRAAWRADASPVSSAKGVRRASVSVTSLGSVGAGRS